jgi:hypothetical protein
VEEKCYQISSMVKSVEQNWTKVLDNFTQKYKFLTERPFDRNTIWANTAWPNAWPKVNFTEKSHLAENKIYQKVFDRKYLKNGHLTENLTWNTSQMTEMTESFFEKWSLDRKVIWPKVH